MNRIALSPRLLLSFLNSAHGYECLSLASWQVPRVVLTISCYLLFYIIQYRSYLSTSIDFCSLSRVLTVIFIHSYYDL